MGGNLRIIVAENDLSRANQIVHELKKGAPDRDIQLVNSAQTLASALLEKTDVLISALSLPGLSSLDILKIIKEKELAIPLIVVSGEGDEEAIVECMKNGAADCITTARLFRLHDSVKYALEKAEAMHRQKHYEKGLRFAQFAYEHAPIGIFWLNDKGRFVLVNESAAAALGYGYGEIHQLSISDVDANLTPERWTKLLSYLRAKNSIAFESRHRHKQGGLTPVKITAHYCRMDDQDYILLFSSDITHRKKADQEYLRMERQVQHGQKMEALGRLSGGVAHEFNNMLMIIQNSAEFIIMDANDKEAHVSFAEQIIRTSHRASALTIQLLTFSRKQQLEQKILDLNATITDMLKWLRRLVCENVTLTSDLYQNIGNIKIDPGELGQIIVNLVMNAGDAMPSGGDLVIATKQVTLDEKYCKRYTNANPGRYLMISVQDTGQGMDEETRCRIFEPFFTTKRNGTGLGLSIVFGIVRQNGGHIECETIKGEGTKFRIFLPRVDLPAFDQESPDHYKSLPRGKETILLVEDEAEVRAGGLRTLEKLGYRVISAQNGVEALHLLDTANEPIHLLLTDVVMPYMSGVELAKKLHKTGNYIKVLYMSAYPPEEVFSKHNVNNDPVYFIGKPFSVEAIATKVRNVLDDKSSDGPVHHMIE